MTNITTNRITELAQMLDRKIAAGYNSRRADPELHWRQERDYALQIVSGNDLLLECSPRSIASALMTAASIGLSLSPERRHCYLIPRRPKKGSAPRCFAVPSYMGLEYLARQSPEIATVQADLVCANDPVFRQGVDRDGPFLEHEIGRKDRGEVTHAYCVTFLTNGKRNIEVVERAVLDQIEASAAAANYGKTPPSWNFYRPEMQKKVATRRAAKHWPISSESLTRAIEALDKAEPVEMTKPAGLLMSEKQVDAIRALCTEVGSDPEQTITNLCAAYGVDSLRDVLSNEYRAICRGIKNRAKVTA